MSFCIVVSVSLMIWLAAASDRWEHAFSFTGQQSDYYNLLVDGFLEGHLYMKAEVHPGRLSPDIEVRQRSPYLLDAAQYGDHYYLYYGVVPAVTVLAPYSLLTGNDLSLNVATLGFVLLGYIASLAWYRDVRRTYFPRPGMTIDCAVLLLLAFGPATTFLIRRAMFYELPLAAGYAFLCGFIWTATRALDNPPRAGRWITLASLCLGLAAGCHPNYALLTPLLALIAWWSLRGLPSGQATSRTGRQLAAAAVLPAAVIGAGLAWYNFARFGSPWEFGFNYGVNAFFETKDKLISAAFLWPNFKWYYLTPPTLLPYFPFIFPAAASFRPSGYYGAEAIHGQFAFFLLLAWIGVGALLYFRAVSWPATLRRLLFAAAYSFTISALFILLLGIRANRYMVDFQMPLVAAGVLVVANIGHLRVRDRFLSAWRAGLLCLTLLMMVNNLLAAVQQFDYYRNTRPGSFGFLTRVLNPSWAFWAKLGLVKTGMLVFDVSFPAQSRPVYEPLLTLGVPGYSDSVYAIQHPGGLLEFAIDHFGYGGPKSRIFSYQPGQIYTVEIELGSFYPPKSDPVYAGSPEWVVNARKTTAKVVFDGQLAIDRKLDLFEAAPWQREIGGNHTTLTAFSSRFSGQISRMRWLAPMSLSEVAAATMRSSVLRLRLVFPDRPPPGNQPLVSWGTTGHGSLLYLHPVSNGQWNLTLDEWGFGYPLRFPASILPGEHTVDLFIGPTIATDSLIAPTGLTEALVAHRNQLMVWLDGAFIGKLPLQHHLESFNKIAPGANHQGFSTSDPDFYGKITPELIGTEEREKILRQVLTVP